jgi:hypothetical protein
MSVLTLLNASVYGKVEQNKALQTFNNVGHVRATPDTEYSS